MEKELFEKAINSILHGHTQTVSVTDSYGNIRIETERIKDLRVELVNKIAEKIVNTQEFREAIMKSVTPDFIKKLQYNILTNIKFSDVPYQLADRIKRELCEAKLEVRKYTVIADVIDNLP